MVEQWTENPCVPGSIPGGTTLKIRNILDKQGITDFLFYNLYDYCTIDNYFVIFLITISQSPYHFYYSMNHYFIKLYKVNKAFLSLKKVDLSS